MSAEITAVKVAGHVADFVHYDPLANLTISKPDDFHTYPELKRRLYSAISDGEEGELSIVIPPQVAVFKQVEPAAPSTSKPPSPEYNTILIRIEYHSHNPVDGLQFILPSDGYPFVCAIAVPRRCVLTNHYLACPAYVHHSFL